MVEDQFRKGEVNPARIINHFEDSEQQKKVAALFHEQIALDLSLIHILFVKDTVEEDLREMTGRHGDRERLEEVVEQTEIRHLLKAHPYDLSGGEQQRAALAKVLLLDPEVILLDEPTKGMDGFYKQKLAGILRSLTGEGRTILMVSHDIEFCAEFGDTCALFFYGGVVTSRACLLYTSFPITMF